MIDSQILQQYRRTYAAVDLDAALYNMEQMHKNLAPGTRMMAVIKTDGYGHGALPLARTLEPLAYVYGFAVATAEEAFWLRGEGVQKPILVLGYTFPDAYRQMVRQEIRPTVFRPDMLEELSAAAKEEGKNAQIHIKVDTGMSRIGVRTDEEGLAFVREALRTDFVTVEGMFTHFARADETDKTAAKRQLAQFCAFTGRVERELGFCVPLRHCSNSAGIVELPEANLDLVRAGITLYGLWPSEQVRRDIVPLKPLLSWKSEIVYCKSCEAGTEVSYGGTYILETRRRIATVPVGYGDGYPRSLSSAGYVLVCGKRAPILGRVCMDQFMIDVTDIPDAQETTKVTLLGKDGEEVITAELLGRLSGRFNYELVCDIGRRVPRVYYRDGKIAAVWDNRVGNRGFRT